MNKTNICIALFAAAALGAASLVAAQSAPLIKYDFNNTDQLNASFLQTSSGVLASSVTWGTFYENASGNVGRSGTTNENLYARLRTSGGGMVVATTVNAALQNGSYFEFTITPGEANLNLTTVTADVGGWALLNSTADFAVSFFLRSSADNYQSNLGAEKMVAVSYKAGGAGDLTMENTAFALPDNVFENLGTSVTFRLYVYSTSSAYSNNQTIRIDNIVVSGAPVSQIPEPGSSAIFVSVLALVSSAIFYRRKIG